MQHLRETLAWTNGIIDQVLMNYQRPAVMWSGGKDSMVMLFMLRARNIHCPVIFHRHPWQPARYEFAERIIREWNLTVYDWVPTGVTLQEQAGILEPVFHYQVSDGPQYVSLPMNVYEPADIERAKEPWVCGARDVVGRPMGQFRYPWDVVFHGHKSSDVDPLMGSVPLRVDIVANVNRPSFAFPLRDWTDKDIWDYTRSFNVPQQQTRYNVETGAESPDKELNPDYLAACFRCVNRLAPISVRCPKLKCDVANVSNQVKYFEPARPSYIGPPAELAKEEVE